MNQIQSIIDVPRFNLCTICGGCVGICPTEALTMIPTSQGILAPQLDSSKCTECGLCLKVCPGYEINVPKFTRSIFSKLPSHPEIGNFLATYAGYAIDDNIRRMSQSGGLISALLIHQLESGKIDGAVVTRWSKQDPFLAETYIARTPEEILEAVGSKFCPVPATVTMKQILKEEGKFAFVGVSCQIHAMRKAEELKPILRKRITAYFGLHCLTIFNTHFFEFILHKHKIEQENVKHFAFRSKKWRGWPGDMRIETYSGRVVNILGLKSRHATRPYFTPWRCVLCIDKLNELSDISFGDCRIARVYGHQKLRHAIRRNDPGQSDIICRTPRGNAIVEDALAANIIHIQPTNWKEILRTTKAAEKKLALLNLRFFSRLFNMRVPNYCVTYYPKSQKNRVLFSIWQVPSLISSLHFFLFHHVAKHRWLRHFLRMCPVEVLGAIALIRTMITNYHGFCRSELMADYDSPDSDID